MDPQILTIAVRKSISFCGRNFHHEGFTIGRLSFNGYCSVEGRLFFCGETKKECLEKAIEYGKSLSSDVERCKLNVLIKRIMETI